MFIPWHASQEEAERGTGGYAGREMGWVWSWCEGDELRIQNSVQRPWIYTRENQHRT